MPQFRPIKIVRPPPFYESANYTPMFIPSAPDQEPFHRPVCAEPPLISQSRAERLKRSLAPALDKEEFSLVYQPLWDAGGTNLVGVEALMRWEHRDFGAVSPAEFVPLAESTGQIVEIGEWVLRRACQQYKLWETQDLPPVLLAVNLSLQQIQQPNFVQRLRAILQETGMAPQQLQLEITESLVFQDVTDTISVLKELQQLGVQLAIDDFGSGYSSLSVLKNLPVHTLKIDRSFLDEEEIAGRGRVILESIINLGQRLQLTVVAEGVESQPQLALLQELGCDLVQGYFLSPPLGADQVQHYFHQHRRRFSRSPHGPLGLAA